MLLDLHFLAVIAGLTLIGASLPLAAGLSFLSLSGLCFLCLAAPKIFFFLICLAALTSVQWLKLRQRPGANWFIALSILSFLLTIQDFRPSLHLKFDPLYLLPFNLQRAMHVLFEDRRGRMKTSTLPAIWQYLFFLPLTLGTIEWFHDFFKPVRKKAVQPMPGLALKKLLFCFLLTYVSLFLDTYFVEPFLGLKPQNLSSEPLFYLASACTLGVAFTLKVWAGFEFSRALMACFGISLERRLFGPFWKARSLVEFWSNWNVPNIVFVREYIYLTALEVYSRHFKRTIIVVFILLWLQQAWWHGAVLWASLNGLAIYLQVQLATAKARYPGFKRRYERLVPTWLKRICTLSLVGMLALLWPGNRPDAFIAILVTVPIMVGEAGINILLMVLALAKQFLIVLWPY